MVKIETQRFDPSIGFLRAAEFPNASGWETLVRMNVQRIQAQNGTWVRNHVLVTPVKPMPGVVADDIVALQEALNRVLDQHVNQGYELPESKDQLFMAVKLVIDPQHAEAVRVWPGRAADSPDPRVQGPDARNIGLRDFLAVQLHERLHSAYLPDENVDPLALFRRALAGRTLSAIKTDGIMAGGPFDPSDPMPQRYLRIIESVVDATANLLDHPKSAAVPRSAATGAVEQRGAEAVAATPVYQVLGRRDEIPSHPAPLAPRGDEATEASESAFPARAQQPVPEITIEFADDEVGRGGDEIGTPPTQTIGSPPSPPRSVPLDELAERYPAATLPTPPRPRSASPTSWRRTTCGSTSSRHGITPRRSPNTRRIPAPTTTMTSRPATVRRCFTRSTRSSAARTRFTSTGTPTATFTPRSPGAWRGISSAMASAAAWGASP